MGMLVIRKLADKSTGGRVTRFDPISGERQLFNPETNRPEPWPLAGISIEGGIPQTTALSTDYIAKGKSEGWIVTEGDKLSHFPGGPEDNQWKTTHTFFQYDTITIKTIDGDVTYNVTSQAGKHEDSEEESGYRVDHFYRMELA